MNHTVDITSVFDKAVRVPVESVKAGDRVFDTTGRTYEVAAVRRLKEEIKISREDGIKSWHEYGSTITIIPS